MADSYKRLKAVLWSAEKYNRDPRATVNTFIKAFPYAMLHRGIVLPKDPTAKGKMPEYLQSNLRFPPKDAISDTTSDDVRNSYLLIVLQT